MIEFTNSCGVFLMVDMGTFFMGSLSCVSVTDRRVRVAADDQEKNDVSP